MRITLRSLVLAPAILAAAAFATHTAAAETVHVQVPFSFTVGHKAMPAGRYAVNHDTTSNIVTLASEGPVQKAYSWPTVTESAADRDVLVRFDENDGSYALHSIQYGAQTTPRLDSNRPQESTVHVLRGQ